MSDDQYLSVTTLTQYLKRKFDQDPYLSRVYLSGEISNFRQRPAHQYFSLKDDHAKIHAVMFKGAFSKLKFKLEDGMKVSVIGRVTMYEASGEYQIVIDSMSPDGVGAFYQAFEQLKAKLAEEGLFDRPKRPLARFPKKVAVVTSPSGAVIHDIMTTVQRRYPILHLTLYPAQVQGDAAADSLVARLNQIKAAGDYDAVIIGRGGGSIEDLWPFNEEKVARTLATMPMPVVSSVGHETDTTIADFVADHRAATPTAAAELVTPIPLIDALNGLAQYRERLVTAMQNRLRQQRDRLTRVQHSVVLTQPTRLYDQYVQRVDQVHQQLQHNMQQVLATQKHRLALTQPALAPRTLLTRLATATQMVHTANHRLTQAGSQQVHNKRLRFGNAVEALDHLSPLKILGRGYTYVTGDDQVMLKRQADFVAGHTATLHVVDGTVPIRIEERKKIDG